MKKSTANLIRGLVLGFMAGLSLSALTFAAFYDRGNIAIVSSAAYVQNTREFGADVVDCNVRSFGMVAGQTVIVEGKSSNYRYQGGYMNNVVRIKTGFEVLSQASWGLVNTPPGGTADDELRVVATACREGAHPHGITTISYSKE